MFCFFNFFLTKYVVFLSRLSPKFQLPPHDIFISTGYSRVGEHGNIKTCCGFGGLSEQPANKLAGACSDVSKMTGRSIKRSPDVIDNVQLNTFSSAYIEYRHFFVFLFSICGIQLTYFSCLERNVVTNTFLLSKKLYKSYKLLFCFFLPILH